ncbi:hypothetical protein BES34_019425 [Leptospira inadai serovar Lyme]|uniref:Uncharacterized protein n=1 Tax=Leptospira inadai serovar Lyme TaxID=293084 RepID=A0ABX4YDH7_9LEPT|nr:hypothetical protein BES34_019425 [Leptospira inadai serovar Lyme]
MLPTIYNTYTGRSLNFQGNTIRKLSHRHLMSESPYEFFLLPAMPSERRVLILIFGIWGP